MKDYATGVVHQREPWSEIDTLAAGTVVGSVPVSRWCTIAKAVIDYGLAVVLLPVALPLIGLAVLAVKLSSQGPGFYTQTRLGVGGRPFRIIKVRTMRHGCECDSGIQWSRPGDARVLGVGRFLRRMHLDELPQLVNVLRGEMSLVGPRPERPEVIRALALDRVVPGYRHRLLAKPGLTGLAQVQLPADSDLSSVRHKVAYDLYYLRNCGPLLDLRLIVATILKAVGAGPRTIRRVLLLPTREAVADTILRRVTIDSCGNRQPEPASGCPAGRGDVRGCRSAAPAVDGPSRGRVIRRFGCRL